MVEGRILYAKLEEACFLKFEGDIRYTNNTGFDEFIENAFLECSPHEVLIDMSETASIDSTNLGLLARIARHMLDAWNRKPTILSPDESITTLLTSIGFDEVFVIVCEYDEGIADAAELAEVSPAEKSAREQMATVLKAHRELTRLDADNDGVFRNIVSALEQDIKHHDEAPGKS